MDSKVSLIELEDLRNRGKEFTFNMPDEVAYLN